MLLATDGVQSWLDTRPELKPLKDVVLSAVLTHHLKLRDAAALAPMPAEPMSFELYIADEDFGKLVRLIGESLELSGAPSTFERIWRFDTDGLGFCISSLRDQVGSASNNSSASWDVSRDSPGSTARCEPRLSPPMRPPRG